MPTAADAIASLLGQLALAGSSAATIRQRRWALGQALTAAAAAHLSPGLPLSQALDTLPADQVARAGGTLPVAALLDPAFVAEFLDVARTGVLSDRARRRIPESSGSNTRARVASLRQLAEHVGATGPDHRQPPSGPRPRLGPGDLGAILMTLGGPARGSRPAPGRIRLAAILSAMWLEPRPAAGLLAMTRDDVLCLPEGLPFALASTAGAPLGLSPVVASTFREWLYTRDALVQGLQGTDHGRLWVAVRSVPQSPERNWRAGMPLKARGLQRSYAQAVREVNVAHAGERGFPLPHSLDLLRRSLADRLGPPALLEDLEFQG